MNIETRVPSALWEAVRMNYERRNFTGAILDGFYFLSDLLRKKSGTEGDGATLIGQALGGSTPKIKLSRLQSESEWNVQKGTEQMLRGFYQSVRNPRSHEKTADSEEDAQLLIMFIGYLVRQIDQAKAQFSRTDFLRRVLDPDFVPQQRYAELLIADIPAGQLLEVFLDVFRSKESGKPEHLRYFFTELLPRLSDEQRQQAYEVISEELKTTDDEATIRVSIGCLDGEVWPFLDEVARLRIENRLVRSIREGRYYQKQNICRGGALGTWATRLLSHFSLKQELLSAIADKLGSEVVEEQDYVLRYFFSRLNCLSETVPPRIESTLRAKLRDGNGRFHTAMMIHFPWGRDEWTPALRKAYDEFEEVEEAAEVEDDDIPF